MLLTAELDRHVSKVEQGLRYVQSGQQACLVGNSCNVQSSTTHTALKVKGKKKTIVKKSVMQFQ